MQAYGSAVCWRHRHWISEQAFLTCPGSAVQCLESDKRLRESRYLQFRTLTATALRKRQRAESQIGGASLQPGPCKHVRSGVRNFSTDRAGTTLLDTLENRRPGRSIAIWIKLPMSASGIPGRARCTCHNVVHTPLPAAVLQRLFIVHLSQADLQCRYKASQ